MKDIQSKTDLDLLITLFYEKLLTDPELSPFFIDIAKIDLREHIKIVSAFWDMALFQNMNYNRNVMLPHVELNRKKKIESIHFARWLHYFYESVDQLFEGPQTVAIKDKARQLAAIMEIKMRSSEDVGFIQ